MCVYVCVCVCLYVNGDGLLDLDEIKNVVGQFFVSMYVDMCVYMYVCMHVCMHVIRFMHICMHVCMSYVVCMYVSFNVNADSLLDSNEITHTYAPTLHTHTYIHTRTHL